MGKFVNWLICGDVDGLDHKEKEEFRQKSPYQTIRGVLGGEDATNVLAANAKLSTYPKGLTSEQAKLMADLQAEAAATLSRSTHGGDWTWQLVNKLTGYPEHVDIKLDVPDVSFPDIDIPPIPANRIRPIRDLVNNVKRVSNCKFHAKFTVADPFCPRAIPTAARRSSARRRA